MKQADFIAELEFSISERSGRQSPVHSGYRPHIEFEHYPEYLTSGQQTFIGQEMVEMGAQVQAEIAISGTKYFSKRLYKNMKFRFFEGKQTIGFGRIMEITNPGLICETDIDQKTINLNLYPADILKRLESDYEKSSEEVKRSIQELILSHKDFRSHRIVRALIYAGDKNIEHLKKMIELAKADWRDLLMNAEYEINSKRVRNFDKEFGHENIQKPLKRQR